MLQSEIRNKTVAIMQPTYLPWMGYFGLMQSVDLFIFLDSVQFSRRSWQQRNQIKTASGQYWLSVPVLSKGKRDQLITEVEIDQSGDFPKSHLRALEYSYKKSPYFDIYMPQLESLLKANNGSLNELNIGFISLLREALGIRTPTCRSSEFELVGTKADLLAHLCEKVDATDYISPPGSKDYLDQTDAFSRRGMRLQYFHFTHPEYPQCFGEFLPYMSTVDVLFNCGPESMQIINKGCEFADQ